MESLDLTQSHSFVDGNLVSDRIAKIVGAIQQYEPSLEVKWVPVGARSEGQAAYAIIHNAPGNKPYVMFYVQNDEEFTEHVLLKIIANDQRNGVRRLSELEAHEAAQKALQQQDFADRMEEANDIAFRVMRSHLNTYKVNDQLTIRD